jgi:hypothetical protein
MVHPDGQYEPALIPALIRPILAGEADLVLGSRTIVPGAARAGGMPRYKLVANRILTWVENRIMGTALTDLPPGIARTHAVCCSAFHSCATRATSASTPRW